MSYQTKACYVGARLDDILLALAAKRLAGRIHAGRNLASCPVGRHHACDSLFALR